MSLKTIYNDIASQYACADRFGALTQSHACAIEQISRTPLLQAKAPQILDLGIGDAWFVKKLSHTIKKGKYTGIDLSPEMLTQAKRRCPKATLIEGDSSEATKWVAPGSQDLVLAHFINAYIPLPVLFSEANALIKPEGYFSLITTTYESFPIAQQYLANFISAKSMWSRVVGHYYKSMVKRTTVASDLASLLDAFQAHGFDILSHQRLTLPIVLEDVDALVHFGVEGSWFLNALNVSMIPQALLIQNLKRILSKIMHFPYQDTHLIDVVLAKKR